MNTASKLLAALLLAGSFFVASNAHAQVANDHAIITSNFLSVEADVLRFFTRPPNASGVYAYYVEVSAPINITCVSATASYNKHYAILFSDRPDFKVMRETVQLAYALNKRVKVFADRCANFEPATQTFVYPVVWAVETL